MELIVAWLALVVSLATGVWSLRQIREQARIARLANVTGIVDVERSLADVPTALRFHGVTAADLDAAGVTAAELAYLVANCSVSGLYHNSPDEDPNRPFAPGNYRHSMCSTDDFRKAWPLVKRMMNKNTFVSRMDATIASIDAARVRSATP